MNFNLFKRVPVQVLASELLYEARKQTLLHETAAEHHKALADMYRKRAERLEKAGATA